MEAILKYKLEVKDEQVLPMPVGAEILTIQNQNNVITLWAKVVLGAESVSRTFRIVGTGNQVEQGFFDTLQFLDTVQVGPMVWHVFETKKG